MSLQFNNTFIIFISLYFSYSFIKFSFSRLVFPFFTLFFFFNTYFQMGIQETRKLDSNRISRIYKQQRKEKKNILCTDTSHSDTSYTTALINCIFFRSFFIISTHKYKSIFLPICLYDFINHIISFILFSHIFYNFLCVCVCVQNLQGLHHKALSYILENVYIFGWMMVKIVFNILLRRHVA